MPEETSPQDEQQLTPEEARLVIEAIAEAERQEAGDTGRQD